MTCVAAETNQGPLAARAESDSDLLGTLVPRGSRRLQLLRLLATVLLLGLIVYEISFRAILSTLASAEVRPLALGFSLGVVFLLFKVIRWWWLLGRVGAEATPREALRSYLGGMAVGIVTPGRVGEAARSFYLPRGDRAYVSTVAVVDKVLDLTVIVAVAAVGCALQDLNVAALILAAVAVGLASIGVLPGRLLSFLVELVPWEAARRLGRSVVGGVGAIGVWTHLLGLAQAVFPFAVTIWQFELYLGALGSSRPGAAFFVLPLMILSNLVPITISGVGVREWAAVILFQRFGVESAVAVNVALLIFVSNSLAPGMTGALLAPRIHGERSPSSDSEARR